MTRKIQKLSSSRLLSDASMQEHSSTGIALMKNFKMAAKTSCLGLQICCVQGSWAHYGGLFFKITHADLQNLDAAASLGLDHYTAAVRQSAGIKVYCEDKFGALVFLAFCLLVGVLIRGGGKSKYTQDYQL
ncbi:hypothetical protein SCP_1204170 [Sparassis crispa]|uniref:Uncharacterized protein n=1 Tax=Sparassis crispa TaxID=139825 RepID=A0A401H172_9APHY|nr:hypothetical protein SCP_1204170 [Sparassis crispa]GBE88186.1 hypothetical protein SCP_1204170 [Sparassis crispa]